MNKSILIITQYYSIGGLETYINTQIKDLVAHGYQIHFMCAVVAEPSLLPDGLSSYHVNPELNIGSIGQIIRGIDSIRQVIREKSVDIVHVHPFDCIFPAVIAADCEKIPSLLTLHGPLSLQHFTKNIYNQTLAVYLFKTLQTILCVSQEMVDQVAEIIDHPSVIIVPNLIDNSQVNIAAIENSESKNWLIASRLDSDKSTGIINFIDFASRCESILGIDIYGAGDNEHLIKTYVEDSGYSEWVHFKGSVSKIPAVMKNYAGFAGMGRGVLEAAFSQIPICLLGYDGIKGIVNDELFKQAAYCNFSGRNLSNVNEERLIAEFSNAHPLSPSLLDQYQSTGRWSQIFESFSTFNKEKYDNSDSLKLYQQLKESTESQNDESYLYTKEFITAIFKTVANHSLKSRAIIIAHDECLTVNADIGNKFGDETVDLISNILIPTNAEQSVMAHLSESEQQNQSLQQDDKTLIQLMIPMAEQQNRHMQSQVQAVGAIYMQKLRYWLQIVGQFATRPDKRYELAKTLYWKLPEPLRVKLHSQRHRYVRKYFQYRCKSAATEIVTPENSPTWVNDLNDAEKIVFITCSFEFDELVNQRPINAAKYFADRGYKVIFIAWQWTPQEFLSKGCSQVWRNVHQVPLYEFVNLTKQCRLSDKTALFIITLPAQVFIPAIYDFRAQGCQIAYDIMDEWECFNQVGQAPWYLREAEETIILQSDYACGVAPSLRDKFASLRSDIEVIGNGYSENVLGDTRNIAQSTSNKVGYFGHLTDSWFDWDIVFQLAEHYPQYYFEFIGYGEPDWVVEKVKYFANILLVGKVMPKDLHQYVKGWSIGLIPFKSGELAQAVDPIKIYEYLYFGLPTLVTGIEHIKRYPMTYFSNGSNILELFMETLNCKRNPSDLDIFLRETTWAARFKKMESGILNKNGIGKLYAS